MKSLLLLTFLAFQLLAIAQKEALNQLDSNGKKDGKWILYLDDLGNKVTDSTKASYYRYTYYCAGVSTDDFFLGKNAKLTPAANPTEISKPILMHGQYKAFDKRGRLVMTENLDQGNYTSLQFHNQSGGTSLFVDFKKRPENQEHSYVAYEYKKNGDIKYYEAFKGRAGWAWYREFSDSTAIDTLKVVGDSTFITCRDYMLGELYYQSDLVAVPIAGNLDHKIPHGHYSDCYRNGQKRSEGQHIYGKKSGEWKYWKRNGKEMKPSIFNFLQRHWYPEF